MGAFRPHETLTTQDMSSLVYREFAFNDVPYRADSATDHNTELPLRDPLGR